jgi:hypothetical protein
MRWTGLFEFLISPDGRRICYRREERTKVESFAVYLLGQVLSFSLVARGIEALHATVVSVNGRAAALVGDCGTGKSTLAAAMLARGFPLLTDDLMVLRRAHSAWDVEPGVARIKLFPSVARRVLGADRAGAPMNPGTSKLVLPLDASSAVDSPIPLAVIYVLDPPTGQRRQVRATIAPLSGVTAFMEIVRAAFNVIVTDRRRLASQFAFAAHLSGTVPVRRVSYARRFAALPGVCDALLAGLDASHGGFGHEDLTPHLEAE